MDDAGPTSTKSLTSPSDGIASPAAKLTDPASGQYAVSAPMLPSSSMIVSSSAALTDPDSHGGAEPLQCDDAKAADDERSPEDEPENGEDEPTESKESITVIVDDPGHRKEIRTSKTGKVYTIETKGLWTTLRSLTPRTRQTTVLERVKKRLKEMKIFWPFLVRFAKEVLMLGRWRFAFHLIGSMVTGLAPALRIYLTSRLITIAQTASEKRTLHKGELFMIAITTYASTFLEQWVDTVLATNDGVLQRRFETMVSEHLMNARSRLDVRTLGKRKVVRDFRDAQSLVHALGDGTFVIAQLIDLFTGALSLASQGSVLWSMSSADNADLALVSVFSASLSLMRWFWRRGGYTMQAITDPNYNRMGLMEFMSHPDLGTFGERKLLGIGRWVVQEYKKASTALGDVSLAAPAYSDPFASTTGAVQCLTDTAIYVLFALKVSARPIEQTTISMSALSFIQSSARGLAGSIYHFVRDLQRFGREFSAFRAYYRVLEIKPMIEDPVEPTPYASVVRTLELPGRPDETRSGMEIEFCNVSFTWPGKKEKALDGVCFKILAGELCAIVGYNGAGKSTLIALIARLVDPSEGVILINGQDIRSYQSEDLHKAMSMLFQSSADLPLTLREFIGIGNMEEINNTDKIRKAAEDAGALNFIEKLENGFDSSFTGQNETETVETLYKDAIEWDADSSSDEDEDDDSDSDSESDDGVDASEAGAKEKSAEAESQDIAQPKESEVGVQAAAEAGAEKVVEKETSQDDGKKSEDKDEGTSGDRHDRLAFSGGERQKLVMARSFMRKTDLAIWDEYSASLDPVAEHDLFKKITVNRGKQTILYITHRFSTVRHADRVLMLEKGKVIESGTHEELIALPDSKYAQMCRLALGEGERDVSLTTVAKLDANAHAEAEEVQSVACDIPLPSSRPSTPSLTEDDGTSSTSSDERLACTTPLPASLPNTPKSLEPISKHSLFAV